MSMSSAGGNISMQLLYFTRKSVMSMSSAGENNFCFCTVLKIFTVYIRTVTKENLVININNFFLLKNCFLFSCLSSEGNLIHNYFLSCNMLFCTLRKISLHNCPKVKKCRKNIVLVMIQVKNSLQDRPS